MGRVCREKNTRARQKVGAATAQGKPISNGVSPQALGSLDLKDHFQVVLFASSPWFAILSLSRSVMIRTECDFADSQQMLVRALPAPSNRSSRHRGACPQYAALDVGEHGKFASHGHHKVDSPWMYPRIGSPSEWHGGRLLGLLIPNLFDQDFPC